MRKFIDLVEGRNKNPAEYVEKSVSRQLKDGSTIKIDFVRFAEQTSKHNYVCDSAVGYIDGEKVGYVKADYCDPKLTKEYPTNYHIVQDWSGHVFIYPLRIIDTYDTVSFPDLVRWVKDALHLFRYEMVAGYPISHDLTSYKSPEITEDRRPEIVSLLKDLANSREMKKYLERPLKSIEFFTNKPFVSYSQTGVSSFNGIHKDNTGRGIGALLYREAAKWFIERGMKGLYASGIQSGDAQLLWDVFEARGWVHLDGDRKYLNPN